MDSRGTEGAGRGKTGKNIASLRAGRAEKQAKWPAEIAMKKKDVFEGYRQMVIDGRRFRFFWRSLKGKGFWVTAKGLPVFHGKTLRAATIAMLRTLMPELTVMD